MRYKLVISLIATAVVIALVTAQVTTRTKISPVGGRRGTPVLLQSRTVDSGNNPMLYWGVIWDFRSDAHGYQRIAQTPMTSNGTSIVPWVIPTSVWEDNVYVRARYFPVDPNSGQVSVYSGSSDEVRVAIGPGP